MEHELLVRGELVELEVTTGRFQLRRSIDGKRIDKLMRSRESDHRCAAKAAMLRRDLVTQFLQILLPLHEGENSPSFRMQFQPIERDQPLSLPLLARLNGDEIRRQSCFDRLIIPILIKQTHRTG